MNPGPWPRFICLMRQTRPDSKEIAMPGPEIGEKGPVEPGLSGSISSNIAPSSLRVISPEEVAITNSSGDSCVIVPPAKKNRVEPNRDSTITGDPWLLHLANNKEFCSSDVAIYLAFVLGPGKERADRLATSQGWDLKCYCPEHCSLLQRQLRRSAVYLRYCLLRLAAKLPGPRAFRGKY